MRPTPVHVLEAGTDAYVLTSDGGVSKWLPASAGGGAGAGLAALAWRSTSQTIQHATNTPITFDTEAFDTGGFYDPAAPARLTVLSDGLYDIAGQVRYAGNSTGVRAASIRKNGTTFLSNTPIANAGAGPTGALTRAIAELQAGDYLELVAYHERGIDLTTNVSGTNIYTWMGIIAVTDPGGSSGGVGDIDGGTWDSTYLDFIDGGSF